MALPLACLEGRAVPAMMAPGRHVETSLTAPNFSSIRPRSARAAGVRQVRGALGGSRTSAEWLRAPSAPRRSSIDEGGVDDIAASLARYMRLTQPLVNSCCTGHHSDWHAPVIATPRLSGCNSAMTSKSVDGPLRT